MAIKATKNRVVVKSTEADKQTKGGIWLPDNTMRPHAKGEVIDVGAEIEDIKIGDIIIFPTFIGQPILDTDGIEYVVVAYEQILALWEGD